MQDRKKSRFYAQPCPKGNRMEGTIGGILLILTLDQVCLDRWACVTEVNTDPPLRRRLKALGLVPGTRVRRRYTSPGRDVAAIELRGSVLALRTSDLHRIRVCLC